MKLAITKLFSLTTLLLISFTLALPEYETPIIVRKDNPFNQPYNPRLDNMNDSSADNYQRYKDRRYKGHLTSEMTREFNMDTFKAWIDFSEKENLHELSHPQMIDNVGKILGKSIDLQNFINLKSGLIVKLLAILDLKLKQLEVLDNTLLSIEEHPGDIHSNLSGNAFWKNKLDELINYSTAVNSNYSLDWSTMCEVLGSKPPVTTKIPSSKLVSKNHLTKGYYPEQEFLSVKDSAHQDNDSKETPFSSERKSSDLSKGREFISNDRKNNHENSFVEKVSKRNTVRSAKNSNNSKRSNFTNKSNKSKMNNKNNKNNKRYKNKRRF